MRLVSCAALGLAAGLSVLFGTVEAKAVDRSDELGRFRRPRMYESPQNMAFELRFGSYVPHADDGLNGTPYRDTFGTNLRYSFGIEVDYQLLRIPYLGTFGPGIGAAYTRSNGQAFLEDGVTRSRQDTSLQIYPFYVVGVLRADVIARETWVPLVPYAKFGLGYALWRASDAGDTSKVDGVSGKGRSYGLQMALGGMLMLDMFDREDAKAADSNLGINHSYVFGEWYWSKLDGFGGDHLQVGTSAWVVGLAFEL
jgi:hypothetical protein